MKTLLKLLAALALVALVNGCASTSCCNHATATRNQPSSSGPTLSRYVDASAGAQW